MGSTPRGPFSDQLTQPLQPPRLPADNQAAMAGWGGPFAAITQFATSFLKGASEGRQVQREQAEQQRARNITALQSLAQQVAQSNLIEPEKESIQRDIMQRMFGEIANTKPPDKKNASPIFNFVTQTAKNLLGPGAPKVKPLGEEDLGALFQRMQSGKTVQSVQDEVLALWNEAANAAKDANGQIIKQRLMADDRARQGLQMITATGVPISDAMKVFLQTVGVTPQEAMMMGLFDEMGGGQQQGPPAAPAQGPAQHPAPDAQASPMMLAASQFAGVGEPPQGSPVAGPLQALTQPGPGSQMPGLPIGMPQQASPQVQPVAQQGEPPAQPVQPPQPAAPQSGLQNAQFPMEGDSDTRLTEQNRALLGNAPLSMGQLFELSQRARVVGIQPSVDNYQHPVTGERVRVRNFGVANRSGVSQVEVSKNLPVVGDLEAAGFINYGAQRPPVQKAGIDQEELAREVSSVNMHIDAMAKDYPELVESYKTQVRLASLSPNDPAGKLRQVVKDMETAIERREQAKDRRIAQAQAAAARGDIQTQTRLMRGSIELTNQAQKIERRESMKAYSIIARHARTAHAAIADKDGAKTGRYDKDMIAGLRDLAMVNMAALITDYNSTVRDGERKMWLEAQGYWQKVSANLRAFTTGDGTMLTPETRRAVIDLVDRMERSVRDYAVRDISPMVKSVKRIAKTHGIDDYSLDELLPPDLLSSFEREFGRDLGKVKADQPKPSSDNPFAAPAAPRGGDPPKPGSTPKLF